MSRKDCRKNHTYHQLLKNYIDGIGRTECPGRRADASALEWESRQGGRSVGKVVHRKGAWEIHLVRIDDQASYRLVKQKLRTFPSRKIAEIVARYMAAADCGQCGQKENCPFAPLPEDRAAGMDICWN